MSALILSDKWMEAICVSQGIAWERCTRVIIDGQAGEPVRMYVTQLGDERILELSLPEVLEPEITEQARTEEGA